MNKKDAEHIAVFYEGQDDLIDILAVSMASVCYNTKSFVDFYILDCGIHDFNKKQLELLKEKFTNFSIEYIPIDLKQFEGLKGWGWGSELFCDCYSRLLIPDLVPNIDRAIYLDTDIMALDDIKKLWEQDIGEYDFAATPDLGYKKEFFDNCTKILGVSPKHIYASAGMLLIDCKKWRKKGISQKLLNIARKYKDKIIIINEDILSIAYNNTNYKVLDLRYNMADRENEIKFTSAPHITDNYVLQERKHIILQHFTPSKPWKNSRNDYFIYRELKHFNSFWFFAGMTPFVKGLMNRLLISANNFNSMNIINTINFCTGQTISSIENYVTGQSLDKQRKYYGKLLGFIPIKLIQRKNKIRVKLFGFIPLFNLSNKQ